MKNLDSVHLQDFPNVANIKGEEELIANMDMVREVCSTALAIRDKKNLRVRLPLAKLVVIGRNVDRLKPYSDIITDEVNVKSIEFSDNISDFAEFKLQIDFKKVGARLGEKMKDVSKAAREGQWNKLDNGSIEIAGETLQKGEFEIKLLAKDDSSAMALPSNDALVQLDTNITEELEIEGAARDVVRLIQQNRKDADLNISDRIEVAVNTDSALFKKAIELHNDYIKEQTLGVKLVAGHLENPQHSFENKAGDDVVGIGISVVK